MKKQNGVWKQFYKKLGKLLRTDPRSQESPQEVMGAQPPPIGESNGKRLSVCWSLYRHRWQLYFEDWYH